METGLAYEEIIELDYMKENRSNLINELNKVNFDKNIIIAYEGPTDLHEYGDSVMGHYDIYTKHKQNESNKHFSKIINMVGLSAITVPSSQLSCGYLIIFKSEKEKLAKALTIAEGITFKRSKLEKDYFLLERGMKENGFIKRWLYPHS